MAVGYGATDGEAGTTVAERSTAAVDVADNSGDDPLTAKADKAAADGVAEAQDTAETSAENTDDERRTGGRPPRKSPELHSGHKLARRYRLEECVTRLDGFSSWRAVDEKLRRAVGVHVLPADHPRARSVLAAARSSALLGDPRFVQVLDAVEENELVYVVHEWLPDATELTALLAAGPLEPHDAYQLVSQVSQAMAAAHREGLAHLRLTPGAVLRASTGQWRIRGLAVNAALRGISADRPQRTDTEAIGALLYAALTQRWPYEDDAHGLSGLPKGVGLIAPDQVRAGVHRGLSEIAMRALANDGATASRQEPACTTPDELAKAVAAMPRIRPPEPQFPAPPDYQRTTYQQGTYGRPGRLDAEARHRDHQRGLRFGEDRQAGEDAVRAGLVHRPAVRTRRPVQRLRLQASRHRRRVQGLSTCGRQGRGSDGGRHRLRRRERPGPPRPPCGG
jgi:hypothetical protein